MQVKNGRINVFINKRKLFIKMIELNDLQNKKNQIMYKHVSVA